MKVLAKRWIFLTEEEYLNILEDSSRRKTKCLEDDDPNKFIAKMGAEAVRELS